MSLSSEGTPSLVAFEQLVAEHGDRVYAIALRLTGSPADAEDVMQDALLKAFRAWDSFRGEAKPSTWLYRITVNTVAERARGRQRAPATAEIADDELAPDWSNDVAEIVVQRELWQQVEAAVGRLPLDLRTVLVLRDVEGQSTAETAEIAGITEAAVKARLHRARVIVRRELAQIVGRAT